MRVFDLRESQRDGTAVATARILPASAYAPLDLWFRFEGIETPLAGLGDALVVGLLTPAMFEGEPLIVEAPVSQRLLDNLSRAQEILSSWYGYLTPVQVFPSRIEPMVHATNGPDGLACCFSGGVDSWYSLLKHQTRASHLLLVRGFDIGLDNDTLWDSTRARIAEVAARLGKRLVTCTTNLRQIADKRRAAWGRWHDGDFWGECLHGSALASIALMMQDEIGELIVPATHTYRQIKPWGSSPLVDALWSNGRVTITHDGCEAGRVDKTRALAACDVALETLRVCYNDTAEYNCGRCEKCLRTMMALRACGALVRTRTFPTGLSLAQVRRLIVPAEILHRYDELAVAARRAGDRDLLRAVEIAAGRRFSVARSLVVMKRAVRRTAFGRAFLPLIRRSRPVPLPPVTAAVRETER